MRVRVLPLRRVSATSTNMKRVVQSKKRFDVNMMEPFMRAAGPSLLMTSIPMALDILAVSTKPPVALREEEKRDSAPALAARMKVLVLRWEPVG